MLYFNKFLTFAFLVLFCICPLASLQAADCEQVSRVDEKINFNGALSAYFGCQGVSKQEIENLQQSNNELILSNITNSTYVQCNEFGQWKEIKTDKYGFNNKNVRSKYNVLIAGDSFAHGFCVDKSKEIHEILTAMEIDTYSIGIAANGPMISLASMIEISNKIDFEKV